MIKFLWFIFLVILVSFVSVWMIENDGFVVINWLGYEITMSALVLIFLSFIVWGLTFFVFLWVLPKIAALFCVFKKKNLSVEKK
jgi:uncharacterized membrane-anchored protein